MGSYISVQPDFGQTIRYFNLYWTRGRETRPPYVQRVALNCHFFHADSTALGYSGRPRLPL
ncbi:hypothetical protein GCM10027318_04900 [Massilia agilis]